MVQNQCIDARRIAVRGQLLKLAKQLRLSRRLVFQTGPLQIEPLAEHLRIGRILCRLDQAQRVAGGNSQGISAEPKGAQERLLRLALRIPHHQGPLRNRTLSTAHLCGVFDPAGELSSEPGHLQSVACRAISLGTKQG